MDWIRDYLTESWLALAVVLGVAEMFSLDLVLIMLASGALAGMVTSFFVGSLAISAAVAIITSVGMLAVVRPELARKLHHGPELRLGHGKLVGTQGTVTETTTALAPGRVQLSGEVWSAQPYDESLTIEAGENVEVFEIRGATAYVHPVPRLEA
jgi:membrane protein implicated in regulation of membrane protease activity